MSGFVVHSIAGSPFGPSLAPADPQAAARMDQLLPG